MSLKKILSLKKYPFIQQINGSNVLTPLSQQIKQNIAIEWIKNISRLPSVEIFVTPFNSYTEPIVNTHTNSLKAILDNYSKHYRVWSEGSTQSIGVIQQFVCCNDNHLNSFINTNTNVCLGFALFCQKHESLYWFQKLQGNQYQWFRNLSKFPLKSKFCCELQESDSKWVLNYKTQDMNLQLLSMKYFSNSSVETTLGLTDCHVISCNVYLDNTLLSIISDSYTDKVYKTGKPKKKMKFDTSLAPFKVGFTFRDSVKQNGILKDLAEYLIESLKLFNISILPFTPNKLISIESCDELGIPYTVILDDESIEKGVVGLRNRDTDTEESVHISRFQQTLCLYLNVIHPSSIRNKY
ncbi:DNA polymerase subunit gamma-2, mitochondrial-like [Oppia nitens]|uniref:DNA polymerase subunit gamma-2, mitochondrial-like n=1 Tax=Oppia nitens TaxID=1686743 RepID=UPI0023DCB338|nr:DNA polymerase subunit gamma-2, mitochondrial-like [Oppia nitens]